MRKEDKAALVDEIAERLGDAEAIFAVDYRGITVPQAAELRAKLTEADTTFRVVKNRLAKRATERAGTAELDQLFEGPTALAFVKGDAVAAAKAISTFGRQHDILEYKGGLMDGASLEPDQFMTIARLPGLDVLRGQLVGVVASPLTGLARGLASMVSGLAVALGQIQEQGLVGGAERDGRAGAGGDFVELLRLGLAMKSRKRRVNLPPRDGARTRRKREPKARLPAAMYPKGLATQARRCRRPNLPPRRSPNPPPPQAKPRKAAE